MADVAISEPSQSHMNIVAHDGPMDAGSAALVSTTKPTRKSRIRRLKDPDPKTRRGREETTENSMANKAPQHKDYLSEQRAKRLGKQRPKGKNEGIRKSKDRTKQRESIRDEVNGEFVKARDASRIVSAGSNTSKDEGISSNTDKDEDFELEGESEIKIVNKEAEDVEDDEGRGSINGDEGLATDRQSDEEAGAAQDADNTNVENAQEDPADHHLDDSQTQNMDPPADDTVEKAEDMPNDTEDDNTGYQGDMDEPNSLATSLQGSLGLSSDTGLGPTADSSVPENNEDIEHADSSNEEQADEATEKAGVDTDLAGGEADPVTTGDEKQAEASETISNESQENENEENIADEGEEGGGEPGNSEAAVDGEAGDNEATVDGGEAGDNEATVDDGETNVLLEDKEVVVVEEEKDGEEGDGNSPEDIDVADNSEVQAESAAGEESAVADEDGSGPKQPLNKEEEEIKEIPAIAKIPGTYRGKRKLPAKSVTQEPDVKKSSKTKENDRSKVMTNRKPISWRPMPVQSSTRPQVTKPKNNKLPLKFRAKHLKPEQEPTIKVEEYHNGGTPSNTLDLPPVNIPVEGGDASPLALNSFRSEGHLLDDESQVDEDSTTVTKAESMPEIRYHDITRPNTAGTKNKTLKRKRGKSNISSEMKKSPSVKRQDGSTSEVWVPEEEKLYVYSYSSQPRLLHVRRMAAGRVATTHQWDHDPNSSFRLKIRGNGNPMYDRRVVRGSNYAKRMDNDAHPKWNPYFTNARSLEQHEQMDPDGQHQHQRRQEFREKLEARARLRRENPGMSSLYTSHAASGRIYPRSHALVQTENYYEPLERPPESEAEVQTEYWGEEGAAPPVMFHSPPGVHVHTQVYESELDAIDEEEAMVAALVSRTVREAVLEVMQEEQAEDLRINRIATASLSSHGKADDPGGDVSNHEGEAGDSATEEREDPDGKETSPQDTEEPARSPELDGEEQDLKEMHLISDMSPDSIVRDTFQESESLMT